MRPKETNSGFEKPAAEIPDRPVDLPHDRGEAIWGSDYIAETLRKLDIPYAALNPGASFRGLHDSLVNYSGNVCPQLLLCLHEEQAVSIAHGYAKITGKPLLVLLHSNVGLMHGSMAIFNAWCDRVPMIILGANGPMDAARRRPWIDWIHTVQDQAALVRDFIKWDDQPTSHQAAVDSLVHGMKISMTAPYGPVYLNFDADLQESAADDSVVIPDISRSMPPAPPEPSQNDIETVLELMRNATRPVILMGRVGRTEKDWNARLRLAESLEATVLTDLKTPASFPTAHQLHGPPPGMFPSPESIEILGQSDVILSLDWIDLPGVLKTAFGSKITATVIQVSIDHHLHRGFGKEGYGLTVADIHIGTAPDQFVASLVARMPHAAMTPGHPQPTEMPDDQVGSETGLSVSDIAQALKDATVGQAVSLIRLPLSWDGSFWDFNHPLDYLGYDGGGGIGSGPGMAVGAALALRNSGRLPVAILGDGDLLMGGTALWTAAHYKVPLLVVVANNRSFYNDEVHQERVAKMRNRPAANKWIGQRIEKPEINLAALAKSQGVEGFGPIEDKPTLAEAIKDAIEIVLAGKTAFLDVRTARGYAPAMRAALRESKK